MIQKVELKGVKLPRLYIAENARDAKICVEKSIPFVKWTDGKDSLIRLLLRPVLERKFPYIDWDRTLGPKANFKTIIQQSRASKPISENPVTTTTTDEPHDDHSKGEWSEVADISTNERIFNNGPGNAGIAKYSIEEYMSDTTAQVDLEVLQQLRLMPAFIGDILDCIKINVGSGIYWREGWNKKRGLAVGRFDSAMQKRNLIILDVSASIPRGIAATMISLIDTLRTQLSADLIITAHISKYYEMDDELPSPQEIRRTFRPGQESMMFLDILENHIKGRAYGHVISFGDNDTPDYRKLDLTGTTVEKVHHYHTGKTFYWNRKEKLKTGYAKWCDLLGYKPQCDFNTDWISFIRKEG